MELLKKKTIYASLKMFEILYFATENRFLINFENTPFLWISKFKVILGFEDL